MPCTLLREQSTAPMALKGAGRLTAACAVRKCGARACARARCTPRSGYVDSLPQSSLLPVFKTMYDNRVQNYLALDTVSAATYAAETYDRVG